MAQILALSPDEVKLNPPVRIRGMVTCYQEGLVFFVQDQTAGIFVYYTGDRLPLRAGQYVEITGGVHPGRYSPVISPEKIQPCEAGPAIEPRAVSLARIYLGGLDAQWVETSGVVRSLKLNGEQPIIELADSPNRVSLWILSSREAEQWPRVGSLIRVRGVVGAGFDQRGELAGFQLFANSAADIAVLEPGPEDLFGVPLRSIRALSKYRAPGNAPGLVRVQGVATLDWPGRALFIQDASGGAEVQASQSAGRIEPGVLVEVVGFQERVVGTPALEDAQIRRLGTNAPPQPVHATVEELVGGSRDNQLVEIEAQFLGRATGRSNSLALALQFGDRLLTGLLAASEPGSAAFALTPGSRLRVSGVWQRVADAGSDPGLFLLLRSPQDIKVVALPARKPTLAVEALVAASITAAAALAIALWVIRRQLHRFEQMRLAQAGLQGEMRQSEQQLRRSLEERDRIGRDLHDDIMQSIYAVGLKLEGCRRVLRQSPGEAEPRLAAAIQTLNETIESVRGFIAGLEPKLLSGREFKTALKSLALTSGDSPAQFKIEVDPAAAKRLAATEATQLLHIAKEAMSNSLRHAQAAHVTVSLSTANSGVCLEIRDDGVGFTPTATAGAGQGLRNMGSRAREIGADLQLFSAPNEGCRILVTVPQRNQHDTD